jgi:zinc protease
MRERTDELLADAMMKRALAAVVSLAIALSSLTGTGPAHAQSGAGGAVRAIPQVMQSKLPNGLTVVLEQDRRAPIVSMELRYAAGSRDDPEAHPGMALLIQRMMVTATAHLPESAYYQTLERVGASAFSQGTSSDYTGLWTTVPSNAMSTVLWLWSDQMGFFTPRVDQTLLDKQRDVVKSERRQNVDNAPYGAVREITRQALYPEGHPYHGMQLSDSLDGVTVRDVKGFFDAHYGPNNAVLVISGDFALDAAMDEVKKYFGPIPAASFPPKKSARAELTREIRLDVAASVQEAAVVMTWHAPPLFAPGDADMEALSRVLSGRRVALLHWALVDHQKIATAVSVRETSRELGSDFEIWANVAQGHTTDEVTVALDATLDSFRSGGIDQDRFGHALTEVWLPRAFALEKSAVRVARYAEYALARGNASSFAFDFDRYDRVRPETVKDAAKHWLLPHKRVVTIVTPDPSAPPCGQLRKASDDKPVAEDKSP